MKPQEEKRFKALTLLNAAQGIIFISDHLGLSRRTVQLIKKCQDEGQGFEHRSFMRIKQQIIAEKTKEKCFDKSKELQTLIQKNGPIFLSLHQ